MLAAINFDDDQATQARKVSDVWTDTNLPAELVTVELTLAQIAPEFALRLRHALAKLPCPFIRHGATAPPIPTFPHKGGRGSPSNTFRARQNYLTRPSRELPPG